MLSFGDLLAQALERKRLSQKDFAKFARVPQSVVSAVIRGRRKPPKRRVPGWAAILNLSAPERLAWERAAALSRADPVLVAWLEELQQE